MTGPTARSTAGAVTWPASGWRVTGMARALAPSSRLDSELINHLIKKWFINKILSSGWTFKRKRQDCLGGSLHPSVNFNARRGGLILRRLLLIILSASLLFYRISHLSQVIRNSSLLILAPVFMLHYLCRKKREII